MDIDNKLDELSVMAQNRTRKAIEDAKDKREYAWSELKEKSPEMADMIEITTKTFGKPKQIKIWLGDELLYQSQTNR